MSYLQTCKHKLCFQITHKFVNLPLSFTHSRATYILRHYTSQPASVGYGRMYTLQREKAHCKEPECIANATAICSHGRRKAHCNEPECIATATGICPYGRLKYDCLDCTSLESRLQDYNDARLLRFPVRPDEPEPDVDWLWQWVGNVGQWWSQGGILKRVMKLSTCAQTAII